jgi:hypothetical protein
VKGPVTELEVAVDWLRDVLGEGPVAAAVILAWAKESGIAHRVLEHARRTLEVSLHQEDGKMWWSL